MSDSKGSSVVGVTGLQLLTILFVALKLLDKIDWSWWWVLSPLLIPLGFVAALFVVLGLLAGSTALANRSQRQNGR